MALAKAEGWYAKSGSKWQTMPDQMMMYRAASFFIRIYAPEISMGMQTREEIIDTYDYNKEKEERLAEIEAKGKVTIFDLDPKAKVSAEEVEVLSKEEAPKIKEDEIRNLFGADE